MKIIFTQTYEVMRMSVRDFLRSEYGMFMESLYEDPSYRCSNWDYLESLNKAKKIYAILSDEYETKAVK